MIKQPKPIVRTLGGDESQLILQRNHVGRIAFSMHDRVDIEPIHYVYDAPWIFGRTTTGAKVLTLSHNSWCAFETDEVLDMFEWQSVVVKGPFSAQHSPFASWDYDQAITALRELLPSTLTEDDPTPQRNIVFGLHASEISGRASTATPVVERIANVRYQRDEHSAVLRAVEAQKSFVASHPDSLR